LEKEDLIIMQMMILVVEEVGTEVVSKETAMEVEVLTMF
jgi:hypothetical protein